MKQVLILFLMCIASYTYAQTLERKAWMGLLCSERNNRLIIDSVLINSSADQLGLKKNDELISFNNQQIQTNKQFQKISSQLTEKAALNIVVIRNYDTMHLNGMAVSKPKFKADWCDVAYQSLHAIGCQVRTIIYSPKNADNTPGVFFIPGYNCGSIESFPSNYNGEMIRQWVTHGYTVYTVEKSGVGDSYNCQSCLDVDLQTDIELFQTALDDFMKLEMLDKDRLFIWGHSMGGIIAPIIGVNKPLRGIMVYGTVFRPWSEFLLEMHRVQKPLTDSLNAEQTEDFVRLIQKVYYEFFRLKKSPAELVQNPEYKSIVESELEYKPGKEDMWGRHWRFWQQLDSINLAKAWQALTCKVMVLHGESDFIQCSSVEPYLIAETVNQSHPGNATLITLSGIDHLMMNSVDFAEAVRNLNNKEYSKGNFNPVLVKETLKWMKRQ